jgi:hypothetical protein
MSLSFTMCIRYAGSNDTAKINTEARNLIGRHVVDSAPSHIPLTESARAAAVRAAAGTQELTYDTIQPLDEEVSSWFGSQPLDDGMGIRS